ncbi:MAG: ATP synthase subunit I [Sodalis sp. (in: enterobacteria)]|uniref:ATP synthase subunit I n=1 Tax=Sodalis sp. (in: enterobacteria) TaxID=1898979 RepID=UPI003F37A5C9
MTLVLFSALFALHTPAPPHLPRGGGLATRLPNVAFILHACHHQAQAAVPSRIVWSFAIDEGLKIVATIALLVVALGMFKAAFVPLGLTYLSVLIVQISALAVINNKG